MNNSSYLLHFMGSGIFPSLFFLLQAKYNFDIACRLILYLVYCADLSIPAIFPLIQYLVPAASPKGDR